MTNTVRVDLFGEVTSKREAYEDPALVYPYDSKAPKRLRTTLTIELDGYANNRGVAAGQPKLGTVHISVDGTDPLAQLTAGKRIVVSCFEPVAETRLPDSDPKFAPGGVPIYGNSDGFGGDGAGCG